MKLALSILALASLLLLAVPSPAAAADVGQKCVNYMYVADYQWYYVCVDPKDASCVVSQKRVVGTYEQETCYGLAPVETSTDLAVCTPYLAFINPNPVPHVCVAGVEYNAINDFCVWTAKAQKCVNFVGPML